MERTPVVSSNIKSVGYDPATHTMEIEFVNGAVWQYTPITPETHESLVKAESVGRYFQDHIRKAEGINATQITAGTPKQKKAAK